jgi:hypothetical protein
MSGGYRHNKNPPLVLKTRMAGLADVGANFQQRFLLM